MPKRRSLNDEELMDLIYREIRAQIKDDYQKMKLNSETKLTDIGLADDRHTSLCHNVIRLADAILNIELELGIIIEDELLLVWKNLNDILIAVKEARADYVFAQVQD